jgi:hypothetical protein
MDCLACRRVVFTASRSSSFKPAFVGASLSFPITAEMPGPACKQRIVCAFFQKRAIDLQAAVSRGWTSAHHVTPSLWQRALQISWDLDGGSPQAGPCR